MTTIEWPSTYVADQDSNCDALVVTEIDFLGADSLGSRSNWVTVDYTERRLVIHSQSANLQSLRSDLLIIVTVRDKLMTSDLVVTLGTEEVTFAVKFQAMQ